LLARATTTAEPRRALALADDLALLRRRARPDPKLRDRPRSIF